MTSLLSSTGFIGVLSLFAAGALSSIALSSRERMANAAAALFATLGSALGLALGWSALTTGTRVGFSILSPLPSLTFAFGIDSLSAFFVLTISLIALCASVYSFGYVKHFYGRYSVGALGFWYNIFIASMLLVVTAQDILSFLFVWEIMSLVSYFLVIFEHRHADNVRAGLSYLVMMHVGTAFITLAMLLLYHATGTMQFAAMSGAILTASPFVLIAIFISALIGFGIKAGIIPLHIWLPSAHPAAPSHVSALMSGVMIKTGIYMLVRIYFGIMPVPPLWLGLVVLAIAVVSSVLGVLYALSEHDIKRLLAYHSIENIGIILIGFGSALIFQSLDMHSLALLALTAGLFHTLNHAIFKALLFLGGGAVVSATGTRDIEHYGGLIKRMPTTAVAFLIGAMAISALPPLNGFFSEWLTFQSLFAGVSQTGGIFLHTVFALAIGGLALTSGLAAACFVKAFGVTFLARPRSEEAAHAHEATVLQRISMLALAFVAAFVGLSAGSVIPALSRVATTLPSMQNAEAFGSVNWHAVSLPHATVSSPALWLLLALMVLAAGAVVLVISRKHKVYVGETWDCGTQLTPRMEITAFGFAQSIITVMRGILRPTRQTEVEYQDATSRYFPTAHSMHFSIQDIHLAYAYRPIQTILTRLSSLMSRIQNGSINTYVLYIFIALIALLLIASRGII